MPKTVKRITIYRADDEWFGERKPVLDTLRARDLLGVGEDGTLSVCPEAVRKELSNEEREVVHRLLGYTYHLEYPLIAKRHGVVGGRAAVAGRRTPVWRIVRRQGGLWRPADVAAELGLTREQMEQACRYAEANGQEIEQDSLDQQWAREALHEVASR